MPRLPALIAAALGLCAAQLNAATLRVGPGEALGSIAEAARLARDGDVVEILPGTYRGDVAVWTQRRLTLRGLDPRPVLVADGRSAEGKAIWVIRNGDITIDNIEFRGARVADGNGAGIRFERGRLHVRNSAFIDNQTGILTANFADAELRIDDSVFADAPRQTHSLPHLLYVGRIARFELSGSRFHRGYRGHLIKSRARHNEIRYNLIDDGPGGEASYEIDLPNGGLAWVIGNVIAQSATTQNPVVVAYGAEGKAWPENALYLAHNTLLSARIGAWFLRVWQARLPDGAEIVATNNLTVGIGSFALSAPGRFTGNVPALAAALGDPDAFDFTLPAGSLLRRFGATPGTARGHSLAPQAEFTLPIGTRPLPATPASWAPGAFQRSGHAPRAAPALEFGPSAPGADWHRPPPTE